MIVGLTYLIARYTPLVRMWLRFIEKKFVYSTFFEEEVSKDLLHVNEGFGLVKIFANEGSLRIGRTLSEANTPENDFRVNHLKSIFGKSKV